MRLQWPWRNVGGDFKRCLFCLRTQPYAVPKDGVAGVNGFICRECIALCVHSVASRDLEWRNNQIEALIKIRDQNAHLPMLGESPSDENTTGNLRS